MKTVKSKFLHGVLVLVNAYKCAKFQLPSSISFGDMEWTRRGSENKNWGCRFLQTPLGNKFLHSECNGTSAQKGYLLPFKVYTMERI